MIVIKLDLLHFYIIIVFFKITFVFITELRDLIILNHHFVTIFCVFFSTFAVFSLVQRHMI